MQLLKSIPLFCGLASANALANNACTSKYQNKLSACSTASSFCSSLLGYTSGGSYTFTESTQTTSTATTTTTITTGKKTVFLTSISYISTATSTSTVTTSAESVTVTSPTGLTGSPTCYISTLSEVSAGVPEVVRPAVKTTQTSCGFKSGLSSAAVSTACSCFVDPHITATSTITKTKTVKANPTITLYRYATTTLTSTTTSTTASTTFSTTLPPCATPDSSCNNTGLQFAYYTALSGNGYPSNSLSFNPALYKTDKPAINGTTQVVSIAYTGSGSGSDYFYGKGPEPLSSFVVDHRGYLYAPQTGPYTFTYTFIDDAAYTWFGTLAYSGWNNTNYNLYGSYSTSTPTASFNFTAGQYVPLRIAFGQGGGAGGFSLDITAPDGEILMSSSGNLTASPYVVAFSCDGTARVYPDFGAET